MAETKLKTNQAIQADAWTTFTPTLGGITIGNGTLTARYIQIGKTVFFNIRFLLGSTSAITGGISFTLPVTSNLNSTGYSGYFQDSGTALYATLSYAIGSTLYMSAVLTNGTYGSQTITSNTVPFTWTTNDEIFVSGTYEAA